MWSAVLLFESCLSIAIGLIYSDLMSSSTASIIGCFILLCCFIMLSILENFVFYNALAFTLSPWFVFLWILAEIVFRAHKEISSTTFTIWFVRYIFSVACFLACLRLCLFFWRYKNKKIPTFQPPRIYSLIVEPRSF